MDNSDTKINRPAIFDWFVFSLSFGLGLIFPRLEKFAFTSAFSFWMLTAVLLYTTGAWLKNLPLSYRVKTTGESLREVPYMLFLLIGHWMIIMVALIFSGPALQSIFKFKTDPNHISPWIIFSTMTYSIFLTWLVYRSKKKMKIEKQYSKEFLFRRELVADIFLIMGVGILSFVFWEKSIISMLTNHPAASISDIIFLFIMLGICYMLFYLPLRYLFFIEDHTSNQTWRRLLLIFGLILVKSLFEYLRV